MNHILYIEDEEEIGKWVTRELEKQEYKITWLKEGKDISVYLPEADLVILDIMLPGLDGFSLGRRIKKEKHEVPVLMLTARTAIEDKVEGLTFADDYLTKPFHPEELTARIKSLLRRFDRGQEKMILRHLEIVLPDGTITNRETGEDIILSGKQYQIFQFFLKHQNQILTKEQIYESVWGEPYIEGDKTPMVHIRYLREKIEKDPSSPKIVETIRGVGYRVKS
ncbi:response regulator transcription factor [Bacillus gobiensis]|uniref:response regulator transcription factor n=1 Tax=Bacillus gobiensis TaxID=1441095 RepID=UPI003D214913